MVKFPKFSQWKQIAKVLRKSEKITLAVFFVIFILSAFYLSYYAYYSATKEAPTTGGSFIEGVIGQPRFLNPIYGEVNDVDRTINNLVFSGLMTYDKNGQMIKDLAESYKISEDGKTYDFILKDNILWHDGQQLTADDIIFTIKTIQNSDYKSPLRANWLDVDIQKKTNREIVFTLRNSYNSFLENCTVKIIPQHIWQNITPENFTLSSYNLKPIGSGLYKFSSIEQSDKGIQKINLSSNHNYYNKAPFITDFTFQFFDNKDQLIRSAQQRLIDGFSYDKDIEQNWFKSEKFSSYNFSMPRYFAAFFNMQKQKILSDDNIRQAIVLATDKQQIISSLSNSSKNTISPEQSPIMPEFFGFNKPAITYKFDIEQSKILLDKSGFKDNGSGFREKQIKKTPAFQFKTYLKSGSKGTEVTELQKCLGRLGFSDDLKDENTGKYGTPTENAVTNFQKKYLPESNPTGEVGKATRIKLNELCVTQPANAQLLKLSVATVNQEQLIQTANILKDQWQKAGFAIDLNILNAYDIKNTIKNRDYDVLIYGQVLGSTADLYPFWHSSQINDPGLNLSEYQSKDTDTLIKDARENLDSVKKQNTLEKLQDKILDDIPAIFLFSKDYIYWAIDSVKGITNGKITDPAKRFADISNWYIKTKRIWK